MTNGSSGVVLCHDCDLAHAIVPVPRGRSARCGRCAAKLYGPATDDLDKPLAFASAGMILFVLANYFPFMTFERENRAQTSNLISGTIEFWQGGYQELSVLVFLASICLPFVSLALMLYLLIGVRLGRRPWLAAKALRAIYLLRPWAMMEVFMLGAIVAIVKLTDFANINMEPGFYAFVVLIIAVSAANATIHADSLWPRIGSSDIGDPGPDDFGELASCRACGHVVPHDHFHMHEHRCPRCAARLRHRKPDSLNRTWALLIAAVILYIPANVYPIMTVISFGQGSPDTIISGVIHLFDRGNYTIAVLVFFASIFVPILKIAVIAFLLVSVHLRASWWPKERTQAYRMTEFIGRWAMIDIFMISILLALVKLDALASVAAGPGAVAFAAVVILTMLAAMSFDPRLIWDRAGGSDG